MPCIHTFIHAHSCITSAYNSICLSIHTKCTYASLVKLFGCKVFIHLVMFFSPLVLSTHSSKIWGETREIQWIFDNPNPKQHKTTHTQQNDIMSRPRDRQTDGQGDKHTDNCLCCTSALCTILSYHSEHSIHFANDGWMPGMSTMYVCMSYIYIYMHKYIRNYMEPWANCVRKSTQKWIMWKVFRPFPTNFGYEILQNECFTKDILCWFFEDENSQIRIAFLYQVWIFEAYCLPLLLLVRLKYMKRSTISDCYTRRRVSYV